jgi:peptidoglycan/xylan/chitin deacetylase (PgdA/CDA1 family)
VVAALLFVSAAHHAFVVPHDGAVASTAAGHSAAMASTATSDAPVPASWTIPVDVSWPATALSPQPVAPPAVPLPVVDPAKPMIALTFDDGPWPGQTEQILSILVQRQAIATFFMTGKQVERAPGLAQSVVQSGMMAGNHSYSHRRLDTAPADVVEWEILWTTQRIEEVTGTHPMWVRAPGGNFSPQVYTSTEHAGARAVLWTIDPQDWRGTQSPEELAWAVVSAAHPNGVILLHDGGGDNWQTIAALPLIIDGLRGAGYQFVTLDQLPSVKGGW